MINQPTPRSMVVSRWKLLVAPVLLAGVYVFPWPIGLKLLVMFVVAVFLNPFTRFTWRLFLDLAIPGILAWVVLTFNLPKAIKIGLACVFLVYIVVGTMVGLYPILRDTLEGLRIIRKSKKFVREQQQLSQR